jgi:hypothetical protein
MKDVSVSYLSVPTGIALGSMRLHHLLGKTIPKHRYRNDLALVASAI